LIRIVEILLVAVIILSGPRLAAEQDCARQVVAADDGSPSELDDCQLQKIMENAQLRMHLQACISEAQRAKVRVYGGFGFSFKIHKNGGLSGLVLPASVFDRTSLPKCFARSIKKRFGKPDQGKPAQVQARFTIQADAPADFSISLTSQLVQKKAKPPKPLPGRFVKSPGGMISKCGLGSAELILRLGSAVSYGGRKIEAVRVEAKVDECEKHLWDEASENWTRSEWRKERDKVRKCLVGLLSDEDLQVRVAAAERIATGRYWRGRRALTATIRRMMCPADCDKKECKVVVPKNVDEGLGLLRMVKAQLSLRRYVKDDVLEALAKHPSGEVRLSLVREVLSRWRKKLPAIAARLIKDPDLMVRSVTCNLGCQRGDRDSLLSFVQDLKSSDPVVRAVAVLYAGNCVYNASREVIEAARREPILEIAILMLQALPGAPDDLIINRATQALYDPCPTVRFLAARLLTHVKEMPIKPVKNALAREPNPALRRQLTSLLDDQNDRQPLHQSLQLWLQLKH